MSISKEMQIGIAGEHLVCADLILKGFIAFLTDQGLPYDVIVDVNGKLLKCQVKTTTKPRIIPQREKETQAYIFNIKNHGKKNDKIYNDSDVDIFALVCIDTGKIGYLKNIDVRSTMNFRVDKLKNSYYDEKGIKNYEKVLLLNKTIKNKSEIARLLNLGQGTVSKMLAENYKPFKTEALYFSDIERNSEWF